MAIRNVDLLKTYSRSAPIRIREIAGVQLPLISGNVRMVDALQPSGIHVLRPYLGTAEKCPRCGFVGPSQQTSKSECAGCRMCGACCSKIFDCPQAAPVQRHREVTVSDSEETTATSQHPLNNSSGTAAAEQQQKSGEHIPMRLCCECRGLRLVMELLASSPTSIRNLVDQARCNPVALCALLKSIRQSSVAADIPLREWVTWAALSGCSVPKRNEDNDHGDGVWDLRQVLELLPTCFHEKLQAFSKDFTILTSFVADELIPLLFRFGREGNAARGDNDDQELRDESVVQFLSTILQCDVLFTKNLMEVMVTAFTDTSDFPNTSEFINSALPTYIADLRSILNPPHGMLEKWGIVCSVPQSVLCRLPHVGRPIEHLEVLLDHVLAVTELRGPLPVSANDPAKQIAVVASRVAPKLLRAGQLGDAADLFKMVYNAVAADSQLLRDLEAPTASIGQEINRGAEAVVCAATLCGHPCAARQAHILEPAALANYPGEAVSKLVADLRELASRWFNLPHHDNVLRLYFVECKDLVLKHQPHKAVPRTFFAELCVDSLDRMLERRDDRCAVGRLKSVAYQVASGLAVLHETNVVHRDLKGANILCGTDEKWKVADFGLAKADAGASVVRSFGGTPLFASPEMRAILPSERNPKYSCHTDCWSFGCVLLEMIDKLTYEGVLPEVQEVSRLPVGDEAAVAAKLDYHLARIGEEVIRDMFAASAPMGMVLRGCLRVSTTTRFSMQDVLRILR